MSEGLSYFIPRHGRPKITLNVPESHSLHVCPAACARRNGIRAIKNGEKKQMSFLYITETDVISGCYEQIIGDAVDTLLTVLEPLPHVFLIYVNCIDDFLGTDENALVEELGQRFPRQRFTVCHIDPVASNDKIPPGMKLHDRLYSFLEDTGKKDGGINLIGNYVSLDPDSEFFTVLSGWGTRQVREIISCTTYNQFAHMAGSRLNLVLMQMGQYAAQHMEERLGIPWIFQPTSYDLDVVEQNYRDLANALGEICPSLTLYRHNAEAEIAQTLAYIREIPILVDSSATMLPFAMAAALCRYGFHVRAVFAVHWKEEDSVQRDWLAQTHPEIQIIHTESYETVLGYELPRNSIAIGFDSAYTLKAEHFVDMQHDESFMGFHGICKLMRQMREALDVLADWS